MKIGINGHLIDNACNLVRHIAGIFNSDQFTQRVSTAKIFFANAVVTTMVFGSSKAVFASPSTKGR